MKLTTLYANKIAFRAGFFSIFTIFLGSVNHFGKRFQWLLKKKRLVLLEHTFDLDKKKQ